MPKQNLFVIVMTILMHDAQQLLSRKAQAALATDDLYDILYADDTLLLGREAAHGEEDAEIPGRGPWR